MVTLILEVVTSLVSTGVRVDLCKPFFSSGMYYYAAYNSSMGMTIVLTECSCIQSAIDSALAYEKCYLEKNSGDRLSCFLNKVTFFAAAFLYHERLLLQQACRVSICSLVVRPTLLALYLSTELLWYCVTYGELHELLPNWETWWRLHVVIWRIFITMYSSWSMKHDFYPL